MPAPAVQSVAREIGAILDRLCPAPEERAKAELARHEVARLPALKQIGLAGQPSLFVTGWRPTIGWAFLVQPVAVWVVIPFGLGVAMPAAVTEHLFEMVLAMLGIAGLRTFEKTQRR